MSDRGGAQPGGGRVARVVRRMTLALLVACAAVFALDLLNLLQQAMGWPEVRHPERSWEGWPGFYAAYGFLAYTAIVYGAKALRKGVMRDEDYYDG